MTNICGCLVHTQPANLERIVEAINALEGGEVHGHQDGRIVVTVEDTPSRLASEQIMDLHQIPGVLTLTLNYHHFEALDEPALEQSLSNTEIRT